MKENRNYCVSIDKRIIVLEGKEIEMIRSKEKKERILRRIRDKTVGDWYYDV